MAIEEKVQQSQISRTSLSEKRVVEWRRERRTHGRGSEAEPKKAGVRMRSYCLDPEAAAETLDSSKCAACFK